MANRQYHLAREEQERRVADAAVEEGVRKIHIDLADRHAVKAKETDPATLKIVTESAQRHA